MIVPSDFQFMLKIAHRDIAHRGPCNVSQTSLPSASFRSASEIAVFVFRAVRFFDCIFSQPRFPVRVKMAHPLASGHWPLVAPLRGEVGKAGVYHIGNCPCKIPRRSLHD